MTDKNYVQNNRAITGAPPEKTLLHSNRIRNAMLDTLLASENTVVHDRSLKLSGKVSDTI